MTRPDFDLVNVGSIVLLTPMTSDARAWADENLPSDRMYFNGSIVIEPRYVPAILDGLTADGLTIQ